MVEQPAVEEPRSSAARLRAGPWSRILIGFVAAAVAIAVAIGSSAADRSTPGRHDLGVGDEADPRADREARGFAPDADAPTGLTPGAPGTSGLTPGAPGTTGLAPGAPGTSGLAPGAPGERPADGPVERGPDPLIEVGIAVADLNALDCFIDRTGVTSDVVDYYHAWADDEPFDPVFAAELRRRGVQLKITWEPWEAFPSGDMGHADQPDYTLQTIIDGDHDRYLRRWARGVAASDGPVIVRLMHEMNGAWYPWGIGVADNTPERYVAAWRHVQDVVTTAGATNIEWEWAPNQLFTGSPALEPLYPGDDHVDRIGVSGYNWGGERVGRLHYVWRSFAAAVDPTLDAIAAFTDAPLGVSETGSASVGGERDEWVAGMFAHAHERELAFVSYFAMDTQRAWDLLDDPASVAAFVTGFRATRAPPDAGREPGGTDTLVHR